MTAAKLFAERGYHDVSLTYIATSVGITAPSLYRHFHNKQDLLLEVVGHTIDRTESVVSSASTVQDLLERCAAFSIAERAGPVLWQRESRHLARADWVSSWRSLDATGQNMASLIRAHRTELSAADAQLLAWATTSVFSSISFHRVTVPRRTLERVLVHLGESVVSCPVGAGLAEAPPVDAPRRYPASMREALLNEAVRLFDRHGFRSVSTDDIGHAVGTSGPNIYKHFRTKSDLLEAAVVRAGERRRAATHRALSGATDDRNRLERLVSCYVDFAVENNHLLGVLVSELEQLPDPQRRASRQAQREFVTLWVDLLGTIDTRSDPGTLKVRVLATLSVIDNLVRIPPVSHRADIAPQLTRIARAVLLTGLSAPALHPSERC